MVFLILFFYLGEMVVVVSNSFVCRAWTVGGIIHSRLMYEFGIIHEYEMACFIK